jgi:signal transduction histidine kinase
MPSPHPRPAPSEGPGDRSACPGGNGKDSPWEEVREHELRAFERERSFRHLLLEVGSLCAGGDTAEDLSRDVITRVVVGLDALTGWVGLPVAGQDHVVVSPAGIEAEAGPLLDAVARFQGRSPKGTIERLPDTETVKFPDGSSGSHALYLAFRVQGPDTAWILLAFEDEDSVPEEADGILTSTATFLGLTIARIRALGSLRRMTQQLEIQVTRKTKELLREKEGLEIRVKERTRELEEAQRAALESERRLLDLERQEGVHQVAAGVAHELNNPLGALKASLDFVYEELAHITAGRAIPPADVQALTEAVTDSLADATRMERLVSGLFGEATGARRAVVRTSLDDTIAEAARHLQRALPGGPRIVTDLKARCRVGIAAGELTRWMFRLLENLAAAATSVVRVSTSNDLGIPLVEMSAGGARAATVRRASQTCLDEFREAGTTVAIAEVGGGTTIHLQLPAACGERPRRAAP